MSWQPTADLPTLKARAELYRQVRDFFLQRQVLEVDVPILGKAATVDPFIESLTSQINHEVVYLQTSPEFFLKRAIAAFQQDMYYLGKAFRQGEQGDRHQPEFTMLEWYRMGWDEHQLMEEVGQLLAVFFPAMPSVSLSYEECFKQFLGVNPHTAPLEALRECAQSKIDIVLEDDSRDVWLDILMSHCIEPLLPMGIVFIYDYPPSQAALAKICTNKNDSKKQQVVARRFEVYVDRLELANGYWELTDKDEQAKRFNSDQQFRRERGLDVPAYDQLLINAMSEGMPPCAGVALGIDRLLMRFLNKAQIGQVISFSQ